MDTTQSYQFNFCPYSGKGVEKRRHDPVIMQFGSRSTGKGFDYQRTNGMLIDIFIDRVE